MMGVRVPWVPEWSARPEDSQRCVESIDAWAARLQASGLVDCFGGDISGSLSGDALLGELAGFAQEHWNFRGGRERNLAIRPDLTPVQRSVVTEAVGPLGLDGTAPPQREHYDAVLMTGGMVRAGIVKPRFLRELMDAGLRFTEGTFLGAFRRFAGDEVDLARALGVDGNDEVDAMRSGMAKAFGPLVDAIVLEGSSDEPAASWRDESWEMSDHRLRVLASPSADPTVRRANTADTFRFWAQDRRAELQSVLVITTPIYVPYQAAVAVEVLGVESGLEVETVAVTAHASDLGGLTQKFLPHHQLQELNSAISGLRGLRTRLAPWAKH